MREPMPRASVSGGGRKARPEPRWLRPLTDYAPLAVFFAAYWLKGMMVATAALLVATMAALALSLAVARRVPLMAVVTAAVVAVFGGLTLWLKDDFFIKIKPTIVQLLFAAALAVSLLLRRLWLKRLMGAALPLPDTAWRTLTWRFVGMFILGAALNEVVWRTASTDAWVTFKVFGLTGLMMAFMLANMPMIYRHMKAAEDEARDGADGGA